MTNREAARPLRRYMGARVRAASLAPTYTITRDVTPGGRAGTCLCGQGGDRAADDFDVDRTA
jgi:hypothetical protein